MADILSETMPVIGGGVGDASGGEFSDSDNCKSDNHDSTTPTKSSSSSPYTSATTSNPSPVSPKSVPIPNSFNKEVMEKLESLYNSPYQNGATTTADKRSKPEPAPRLRFAPNPHYKPETLNLGRLKSFKSGILNDDPDSSETRNGRFYNQRRINSETCLTKLNENPSTNSVPDLNNIDAAAANNKYYQFSKSKSISNISFVLPPIPENANNNNDNNQHYLTGPYSDIGSTLASSQLSTATPNSVPSTSNHSAELLFRKNQQRFNSRPNRPNLVGKQGRSTLPNQMSYSFGSMCHLSSGSSVNSTLTHDEMLRIRYLTYGTSAQLRQEYDRNLSWPSSTEFRLRRKFRRFKRRARKMLRANLLNRLQNVRRLVRIPSRSSNNNSNRDIGKCCTLPHQTQLDQNVSRSSSLTSLLNLIEEANKNLIDSFNNSPKLNEPPPKCPPRLKRAASSINVNNANGNKNGSQLTQNSNETKILATNKGPMVNCGSNNPLWDSNMDTYQIAFIDKRPKATANPPNPNTNSDQNDSDSMSVKSLESYFGSGSPMVQDPSMSTAAKNSNPENKKIVQQQNNPKVLRVRSHFQINNGTVYLEDSDWEMCSEMGGEGGPDSIKSNLDENNPDSLPPQPQPQSQLQPIIVNSNGNCINLETIDDKKKDDDDKIDSKVCTIKHCNSNQLKQFIAIETLNEEQHKIKPEPIINPKPILIAEEPKPAEVPKQITPLPIPKPNSMAKASKVESATIAITKPNPANRQSINGNRTVIKRPVKKMAPKAPVKKMIAPKGLTIVSNLCDDGTNNDKSKQSMYHKNCCRSSASSGDNEKSNNKATSSTSTLSSSNAAKSNTVNKSLKFATTNNKTKTPCTAATASDLIAHKKKMIESNVNGTNLIGSSRNIDNDKIVVVSKNHHDQKSCELKQPKQQIQTANSSNGTKKPTQTKTKSKIMMMKTNLLSKKSSSKTNYNNKDNNNKDNNNSIMELDSNNNSNKSSSKLSNVSSSSTAKPSVNSAVTHHHPSCAEPNLKSSNSNHQIALIDRIANKFMMTKKSTINNSGSNSSNHNYKDNDDNDNAIDNYNQAQIIVNDNNNNHESASFSNCSNSNIIHNNYCANNDNDFVQQPTSIAIASSTCAITAETTVKDDTTAAALSLVNKNNYFETVPDENLNKSQTNVVELVQKFNNLTNEANYSASTASPALSTGNEDKPNATVTCNNNNQNLNLERQFEQYFQHFFLSSKLQNSNATTDRDDINSFCSKLIQDLESKFNYNNSVTPQTPPPVSSSNQSFSNASNFANFSNNNNLLLLFFLYNQRQMFQEILHQMLTASIQNKKEFQNQELEKSQSSVSIPRTLVSAQVKEIVANKVSEIKSSQANETKFQLDKLDKSQSQLSEFNRLIQLLQTSLKNSTSTDKAIDNNSTVSTELLAHKVDDKQKSKPNLSNNTKLPNNDPKSTNDNQNGSTNVNCSASNRFVNKIILNNSINQFNFNMDSKTGSSTNNCPPVPSIVNVINDNSSNYAANLFDVNINQNQFNDGNNQTNNDNSSCAVSVNVSNGPSVSTNPSHQANNGQHKTVLEIKNPSNKFGGLFSTIRYQLEKKRNKNLMQRMKKSDSKVDSLTTVLENCSKNSGGNFNGPNVTVANTSTLEIKGINVAEISNDNKNSNNNNSNHHSSTLNVSGTLRRLLLPSRDGGSLGGSTTKLFSKNKTGSIMEISEPNPVGLESMFGTIRRQPIINRGPHGQLTERCKSELNFRSIVKLNEASDGYVDDREGASEFSDSHYDSMDNDSDYRIYDRIDGRRKERELQRNGHRFGSQISIQNRGSGGGGGGHHHPTQRVSTSQPHQGQYFGSQINLYRNRNSESNNNSSNLVRYKPKPVVTFTLPRSFKNNNSKQTSNRNLSNLSGRFNINNRHSDIIDPNEEDEDEIGDEEEDGEEGEVYYEHDKCNNCDNQESMTTEQQDSDSSNPESDRTVMSRHRQKQQQQQQQQSQPQRRRQQLYLPPKSPVESIDDECEYFLTPCKLNERYFRSRSNRFA